MNLFDTFKPLRLKNRSVMAPMTRYACNDEGIPSSQLAEYYIRRAQAGVGLVIVESCAINPRDGMGYLHGAQFFNQSHCEAWKPIVKKIHEEGSQIWIQLFHPGRLTVEAIAGVPQAPSAIAPNSTRSFWRPEIGGEIVHFQTKTPFKIPREMSIENIKDRQKEFAHSCRLAQDAGFDGVELHGAHGYLLHQFCHRKINQRTDEFSASPNFKFVEDLVGGCRSLISKDFVLSYRLSLHMVDNYFVRFSNQDLDFSRLVQVLDGAGVDVFHSSEYKAGTSIPGQNLSLSQIIKSQTDKPVIVCGSIRDLESANSLLASNCGDLIAFGRPLIANYDLIARFKEDPNFKPIDFQYEMHMAKIF